MKISKKTFLLLFNKNSGVIALLFIVGVFFWKTFLLGLIPFPGDFVVGIYHPWLDYKWGYETGVPVKNPIVADVPSFMYPMQTFAVSQIKSGQWPLWNPYILGGAPLMANFQSAPLSITNIFYFIFSDKFAWGFQIISAHVLAALFTYILLRHWKLSRMSAVFGGVFFAFTGYNLIWSQWNGHVLTAAFLPLMILFVDRYFKRGGLGNCIGLAIALALQIFGGYPQIVLYTAVIIGVLPLFHLSFTKKYFYKLIALAIFSGLGFALAAIQLFPSAELLSMSQWTAEPHPRLWAFLPWEKTITFIASDFFGNHVTGNYWGPQDYTSNTGFIGVSVGLFSFIALIFLKKKREVQIAGVLAFSSLLLSFHTPVAEFLWVKNLFGMQSSSAHRALVLFNLGCALLAGFGIEYVRKNPVKLKLLFKIFLPTTFFIVVFGIYALQTHNGVAERNLILPSLISLLLFICFYLLRLRKIKKYILVLILLISVTELYRFGWKFTPFSTPQLIFPDTPITTFLKSQEIPFRITNGNTMPVNFQMEYGLETLGGYETMRPLVPSRFIAALNNNNPSANPAGRYGIIDNDISPLLDLVNTKYYLTLKKDISKYDKNRFSIAFEDKSTVILQSKTSLPRAFMVYDWEVDKGSNQAMEKLLSPEFPFSKKIILEEDFREKPSKVESRSSVEYVKYLANESEIKVTTDKEGLLFVSDSFFPGWQASVDNNESKIYKADFAFRAVYVTKGEHIVRFIYKPDSFSLGLKISAVTLVLLALIGVYLKRL